MNNLHVIYKKEKDNILIYGLVTDNWLKENKHMLHDFRVKKNVSVFCVPIDKFVEEGVTL